MGANGAGGVDLGGHAGFNPAAMMAGIAVGGAVGQNIAGTMSGMIGGVSQPVPPPIPQKQYHVAVNGAAAGPYTMNTLQQMANAGQLSQETLVWTAGMAQWAKAGELEDFKNILEEIPPIPPIIPKTE